MGDVTKGFPAWTALGVALSTSVMLYFFHYHFEWFAAALLAFYLLLWWKKITASSIWEEASKEGKRIFRRRSEKEKREDEGVGEEEEGEEEKIEVEEAALVATYIEDLQAASKTTGSTTTLTYRAPSEQCLPKDDEEVMEILEKFDEVELDFEDDKILIRGPTEMVHQVYDEFIETFGEEEEEEEEEE